MAEPFLGLFGDTPRARVLHELATHADDEDVSFRDLAARTHLDAEDLHDAVVYLTLNGLVREREGAHADLVRLRVDGRHPVVRAVRALNDALSLWVARTEADADRRRGERA